MGPPLTLLAATQHGSASSKRTVVLLHGMLTSGRYWDPVVERLEALPDVRVITLDLLGFGRSPAPRNARYDYGDHVDAVTRTLEALGVHGPVTLVGHSMGALIGLRLAATRPESVARLVLVGMPVYDSRRAAREGIIQNSVLRRVMLYGVVSRLFCLLWCQALKPLSSRLAPLYIGRLPAAAASASVQHSWPSYSRSLRYVVEEQDVSRDLDVVRCPTLIVNGHDDLATLTPERLPETRADRAIDVVRVPGDHQLPVEQPDLVARIIAGHTLDAVAEG